MLRNSITVRTFSDWNDPAPGSFEMDFVAHCGKSVAGSHLHSLVLTDVSSGWTEAAAMVVREQSLVTETVQAIRARLPFPMLGLDVDNDGAFINETMLNYCRDHQLELTRSRAYRKNDQAWIEQKDGAAIRKMVGYGRLEGLGAAAALATLHDVVRLEAWPTVERWLMDSPDTTAKELFLRLQELTPDQCKHGQLRTLQRRVKVWRSEMVRHLVFGAGSESATNTSPSTMVS